MATAKIVELDETNTCKICDNALAKYSCPRCNILYCSLKCYQSISHLECSENFYKDNILSELSLDRNSEESKAKMLEILERTHENNKLPLGDNSDTAEEYPNFDLEEIPNLDSDDDEIYSDIADRLAGVNLDDAEQVWEKLTEDEKQEFVSFLKSEDVTKLIPSWQPWWLYYNDSKVEDVSQEEEYKNKCPVICDIKDFSQITTKSPADCVKYNLINIIAAYAFATRYFNGEHFDFAKEAASCIVTISLALKVAQNFDDFETSVKSVEQECINSDWIVSDSENILTMREDLEKILKGPKKSDSKFYIICALSDFVHLLEKAILPNEEGSSKGFSKQFPNDHFPAVKLEDSKQLKNHQKKIEFFLSFARDCFQYP
ncbi:hypothetical protein JTB14_024298 [Gonioctena quinquepunctata]|nr:hypothetical protein JTB14_024298 [Gonioctena quinquepunctata]